MSGRAAATSSGEAASTSQSKRLRPVQRGARPRAAASPGGASAGSGAVLGKSMAIHSPSRAAESVPLRVAKSIAPAGSARPLSHSAWALARVAWPQSATSATGVNQRSA